MADMKLKRVQSGAALVKKLLEKADNGDQTLTVGEVDKALGPSNPPPGTRPDTWSADLATRSVLTAAVNKTKSTGDRTLDGIKKGVDAAFKEIKAADLDGDGALTVAEQKKVKTNLGKLLMGFAEAHGDKSVTWFKIKPGEEMYVPKRPFRAPANATASAWVDAAVKHFNGFSNDNSTHGRRPDSITRYVLGTTEAKGIVSELEKLTATKARAALRALDKRINTGNPLRIEDPKRVYLDEGGQKVMGALAKKLGISVDLKGEPKAPKFDYY
jgi:hypothetical protein